MSLDPKVYRAEDLAALVADTVLRLFESVDSDPAVQQTAAEVAQALRDGEKQGLGKRGNQYWYWVAALESAFAYSIGEGKMKAHHRALGFRALRLARLCASSGSLLPVTG